MPERNRRDYQREFKRREIAKLKADPVAYAKWRAERNAYKKKYRETNGAAKNAEWRAREKAKKDPNANRKYYIANRERLKKNQRQYYQNNKKRCHAFGSKWRRQPKQRVISSIYNRIWYLLRGGVKSAKTMELVGCTCEELRRHLENQFTDGMSWDNYGPAGWHIDHITPISHFDMAIPEEQRKACHFSNLQPLWHTDNMLKGNRFVGKPPVVDGYVSVREQRRQRALSKIDAPQQIANAGC